MNAWMQKQYLNKRVVVYFMKMAYGRNIRYSRKANKFLLILRLFAQNASAF